MGFMHISVAKRALRRLCVFGAIWLTACGTVGTQDTTESDLTNLLSIDEITPLIESAEILPSPDKDIRFIALAKQLNAIGEQEQATAVINQVYASSLPDENYIDYILVASEIYKAQDSFIRSYNLLTAERSNSLWSLFPRTEQKILGQEKARLYNLLGLYEKALLELIQVDAILQDPLDITENHDLIWQQLINLPLEELTLKTTETEDPVLLGWYTLAKLNKQYQGNIEAQSRALTTWQSENPNHPASLELPLDLQLLQTLIEERPQRIALLLPLSGDFSAAGKAIRDGFFAAYYTNQDSLAQLQIDLFDTNQQDIVKLYDDAVRQGANLIIGPLRKENVSQLQQHNLVVTTLALNYVDQLNNTLEEENDVEAPLFQFGLSLEQEAIQAAERAWLEGHRYAMVVADEANWSQRAADAFSQQWQSLGGIVVKNQRFAPGSNYSDAIKAALNIDSSNQRSQSLKRLFGSSFEFEPRRRKDVDMIFLVSRSREGQQIKPTLAFHYAGDIPVYATSQIYSSLQSADKNRDLNGIRFSTLPWILEAATPEKEAIDKNLSVAPTYERLYAMGADSFLLHDKLNLFKYSPGTSIYGNTGKLYLGENKSINREQVWAEIVKGKAQPLPQLKRDDVELEPEEEQDF